MSAACSRAPGLSPKISDKINGKLLQIAQIFPGVTTSCVVHVSGRVLTQIGGKGASCSVWTDNNLLEPIVDMKRSAADFGDVVHMTSVPIVHLKGNTHILSVYDAGDYYITLSSEATNNAVIDCDTNSVDERVSGLIDELKVLLRNVIIDNRRKK